MKVICKICGKEFEARNKQEKFCKREHIVKCSICNKNVLLKTNMDKSNYLKRGFKTCSQKCAKQQMLLTNKQKYGYTTPFSNKKVQEKIKQTNLQKYGVDNAAKSDIIKQEISKTRLNFSTSKKQEITKKIQKTNLKKYGLKSTLQLPKSRKTMKERYKAEYTGSSKILQEKMKQTNLKKYGVDFPFQSREIQEQFNNLTPIKSLNIINDRNNLKLYIMNIPYENRTIKYTADKLKTNYTQFTNKIKQYGFYPLFNHFTSTLEYEIKEFLQNLNINYKQHYKSLIYPYELDFYIPEYNLAIECNGTYYHSTKVNKNRNYHYNKSKLCEEKGIRLIHIFEYEWNNNRQKPILENIIKNALGINNQKIYARKCKIVVKESKEMREFFDKNNIQGFRGGKFAICLEYNNEIVMSYMMGHPYFGKGKYQWEVIRGATKLGYTVIGGASKIFNYFIKNYNSKNCVYYIDYNYFNGNSLKYLPNMKYIKTQPSFKNYFVDTKEVKNRDPKHHKEITELYKQNKVLQIWNAGTKVYLWENN